MNKKVFGWVMAAALSSFAAHADNDPSQDKLNKQLKGQFRTVGTWHCAVSSAGFSPAPQLAALGPVTTETGVSEGIVTYDGKGSVTIDGTSTALATSPTAPTPSYPVAKSHWSCSGTYVVNADGSFREQYTCGGNVVTGQIPGLAFTQTNVQSRGRMLGKKIGFSLSDDGNVEAVSTVYGSVPRVCVRTVSGQRIGNDDK